MTVWTALLKQLTNEPPQRESKGGDSGLKFDIAPLTTSLHLHELCDLRSWKKLGSKSLLEVHHINLLFSKYALILIHFYHLKPLTLIHW